MTTEVAAIDNETSSDGNDLLYSCHGDANITHMVIHEEMSLVAVYAAGYVTVIVVGLLGNALVIHIVWRNASMHTVTNYFIVNLAVADILVCLLVLPITLLTTVFFGWSYGEFLCKAVPFVQGVAVNASINSLAAIAFDRYLAICYSLRFKLRYWHARAILALIWLEATLVMLPWPIIYTVEVIAIDKHCYAICRQAWPKGGVQERDYFLGATFVTCYCLPLTLISVCYILITWRVWFRKPLGVTVTSTSTSSPDGGVVQRSKVKVVRMLLILTAIFAASWLPLYAIMLVCYYGYPDTVCPNIYATLQPIFQWLGASNSCVNPVIYCFASNKWRAEFRKVMPCLAAPTNGQQGRYVSVMTSAASKRSQYKCASVTIRNRETRNDSSKSHIMSEL